MKTIHFLSAAIFLSLAAMVNSLTAQNLTFSPNTYPVGINPQIAVADINGDGRLDLITANAGTNTLTVLTNNGNGGFGYYATFKVGNGPQAVRAADLNGDGKLELITGNWNDKSLTVLTNNGQGAFGTHATLTVGARVNGLLVADLNGNGKMALISPNQTTPGTMTIFTNNDSGGYGLNATLQVGNNADSACATDVNGDGYMDLICASPASLTVLTNNGSGVFGLSATLTQGIYGASWVIAADVNGDGKPDLVCANNSTNLLTIFTNNGSGSFGFNTSLIVETNPYSVIAADLNGDGSIDLISGNTGPTFSSGPTFTGNTITVFTNNGHGIFTSNVMLTVGIAPVWIAAADLNADGRIDLIASNWKDNTVTVLLNTSALPAATTFPDLDIIPKGLDLRVSWPSISPGWSLEENPNLMNTNWLPCGYDGYFIADDGTNKSLTLPFTIGNNLFFRLWHP